MAQPDIEKIHISQVRAGDTVLFDGHVRTVGANHLTYDSFMGQKLFGDCHMLGHKPVLRLRISRVMPTCV